MPIKLPTEQVPNKLPGNLVSPHHDRLYQNIDLYAQQANIAKHWLWTAPDDYLSEEVLDWTKNFRFHGPKGKHGMIVWGGMSGTVDDMFCAMCGLLSRNFIWGRCLTLREFIEETEDSDIMNPSCVFVSNLSTGKLGLPDWKLHTLIDGLKQRGLAGKQTVAYVDDEKALKQTYGEGFHEYLRTKFHSLEF